MPSDAPFAGRFERLVRAGAGAHGVVWYARDLESGAMVALKVLHEAVGARVARFEREARILASLSHPRIARHVAHGVTDGEPWLAMEWLDGETVAERLRRAPLTLAESVAIARGAAEGLAAAHAAGIVHRDVKPSNLFLAGKDPADVRVVDFGVARRDASLTMTLTATNALVGTLSTMAPEQLFGAKAVGPPADVYSLGCVLYLCVTGREAQPAVSVRQLVSSVLADDPPPMSELVGGVPPALDALCRSMLARSPEHRPSDGAEVAAALAAIDLGAGADATPTEPVAMSHEERRPVCVVAARGAPFEDLARAAARERGRAAPLGDDGAIVWWRHPHAEARRALRFAEGLPPAARAELVIGFAVERGATLVGEVVAQAVADLAREGAPRIGLGSEARALLCPTHDALHGRERELAQIQALHARAEADGERALMLVVGEPGMGKSALLARLPGAIEGWDDVDEPPDRLEEARAWLEGEGGGLVVAAAREPSPAWRALAAVELRLRPLSREAAEAWTTPGNAEAARCVPACIALLSAGAVAVVHHERAAYWSRDAAARRALRAASLLRPPFDAATIEAMIGAAVDLSTLPDVDDGALVDPLTRRAAFAATTHLDRRLGCRLAAAHLEAHDGDALAIAETWAAAEEGARALPWYARAARRALATWAPAPLGRSPDEWVVVITARALRLAPPPAARGELLAVRGLAQVRAEAWRDASRALEEALELLVPGTERWYEAAGALGAALRHLDEPADALHRRVERARPARGAEPARDVCLARLAT